MSYIKRQQRSAYLFLLPATLLLILVSVIPILCNIIFSFTDYNIIQPPQWIGLANFTALLKDSNFKASIGNTVFFVGMIVPIGTILALLLAVLLNQPIKGIYIFRTSIYLPQTMSFVAGALLWMWLYDPIYGLFNNLLISLGLEPITWLTSLEWAMPSIMFMSLWRTTGYYMVIYLAALQGIPEQVYEAAKIDGAGKLRTFFSITLPLLMPTTFFIIVMWSIGAMQMFTQAYVMTGGGPAGATRTVVYDIYLNAFQFLKMGYASAESLALFVVILLITLFNNKFFSRFDYTY